MKRSCWTRWAVVWVLVSLALGLGTVQAQTPVERQLQLLATTGTGDTLSVLGYSLVTVQITGGGGSDRVVTWQVSETGTRFDPVTCKNLATLAQATTASADGTYQCPVAGNMLFRAPVTAGTTGNISVFARALANVSGGGGGCVNISDLDGVPLISCASTVKFSNGAVSDNGDGSATVITGAGGGGDASTNTAVSVDNENVLFSGTGGKTLKRSALTAPVVKSTAGVLGTATPGTDYGDASTNTATSVDSEAALFSGTAGKTLKRSALTAPIVKSTAGVLGAATPGTDYGDASTNTATAVDGETTLFSGTGGKLLKRSALTAPVVKSTAGVQSAAVAGTDYAGLASPNVFTGRQDATGAASTAPAKLGTSLPVTCLVGDLFFKSDATPGQNLFECTATNTWTQQLNSATGGDASTNTAVSADGEIALFSGTGGKTFKRATGSGIAKVTGGVLSTATPGTDYVVPSGIVQTSNVLALNGTNCPSRNFPLGVDTAANAENCTPAATLADPNTFTARQDATGATSTAPVKLGSALPVTCQVGDLFFRTGVTPGQNLYECASPDTWTQQLNTGTGGSGCVNVTEIDGTPAISCVSAIKFSNGAVANNGDGTVTVVTGAGGGGDASTNTSVAVDNEVALFSGTGGKTLKRSPLTASVVKSTAGVLTAATPGTDYLTPGSAATLSSTNTFTGRQDATGAASTAPAKTGTTLPGTCTVGDLFFKSDATPGQNLYECAPTNVWTQQLNSGGGGGGGTWGSITGTLASQLDLQAALDAKVPVVRTVNTHPLSSDVVVTRSDVGLGNVDNTSDAAKNSATATLTNHEVAPRTPACAPVANVITPNADSTDVCESLSLGAATQIANPSHTGSHPYNQQMLDLELSGATAQALSFGTDYNTTCGLPLPTSISGSNIRNRFRFRFSTTDVKWCLIASTKGDDARITTLASNTTYTCPDANSDICQMQMGETTGTLTVADPGGSPFNGKELTTEFLCTNSQTFSWNAKFIAGPGAALLTTCPPDVAKWSFVTFEYSTVLSKYQAKANSLASSVPGTVVKTDQGNTYTTGAQDFSNATSVTSKIAAGYAPTVSGSRGYDSTQQKYVAGNNGITTSEPVIICIGDTGSTNDSTTGSGSFVNHTPTCTIPADWFLNHKQIDVCTYWRYSSVNSSPTVTYQLKYGSTVIFTHPAQPAQVGSANRTYGFCFWLIARAAPSGAASVSTGIYSPIDAIGYADTVNNTSQPVNVVSNASNALTVSTKWNTAQAGNTIAFEGLRVTGYN